MSDKLDMQVRYPDAVCRRDETTWRYTVYVYGKPFRSSWSAAGAWNNAICAVEGHHFPVEEAS